jgi:hypothetical protein
MPREQKPDRYTQRIDQIEATVGALTGLASLIAMLIAQFRKDKVAEAGEQPPFTPGTKEGE